MKTENALGVVPATDCLLTQEERQRQLDPKRKAHSDPSDQVCTIKLNSTYLETVDVYHDWKGALSAVALFFIYILSYFSIEMLWGTVRDWNRLGSKDPGGAIFLVVVIIVVTTPLLLLAFWMLRFDSFRLTHCPIRLNRKNRMMYMFRRDGTVASVPWDEAFFSIWNNRPPHGSIMGLQCHILDKSGDYILDTYLFDYQGDKNNVLRLWEYMRRYMEEGPKEVFEKTDYCLPIGDRKEPPWFGFVRLLLNLNGWPIAQLIFSPLILVFALGRVFATLACKIPKWPEEVEAACVIEPGDPYVKDWRTNPPLSMDIFFGKSA